MPKKRSKTSFFEVIKIIFASIGGVATIVAIASFTQDLIKNRVENITQSTLLVSQKTQQNMQSTLIASQLTQVALVEEQLKLQQEAASVSGLGPTATAIAQQIAQLESTRQAAKISVYNFDISGTIGWQPTIQINKGNTIWIRYMGGQWAGRFGLPDFPDIITDAGGISFEIYYGEFNLKTNFASLIGKIGEETVFPVGKLKNFTAESSGIIYLRMHDIDLSDNSGSIQVQIQILP